MYLFHLWNYLYNNLLLVPSPHKFDLNTLQVPLFVMVLFFVILSVSSVTCPRCLFERYYYITFIVICTV